MGNQSAESSSKKLLNPDQRLMLTVLTWLVMTPAQSRGRDDPGVLSALLSDQLAVTSHPRSWRGTHDTKTWIDRSRNSLAGATWNDAWIDNEGN